MAGRTRNISSVYEKAIKDEMSMDSELLKAWDKRLAQTSMESNTLVGGIKIKTHAKEKCIGYWCCIHNQSPHHMRSWEQHWDEYDLVMYRICEHEIMHPDPDDPSEFRVSKTHKDGCDGCCRSQDRIKRRKP